MASKIYRDEKPLILHPEIDEPEKHIIFLPNGSVIERTKRSQWTIKICNLNREELVLKRKKIIDDYRKGLEDLIDILAKHTPHAGTRSNVRHSSYRDRRNSSITIYATERHRHHTKMISTTRD